MKGNGYRFYDAKQLYAASHIKYLRYLGFDTNQIKAILSTHESGKDVSKFLQIQLSQLENEQIAMMEKISALKDTIEKLKKEETIVSYQVEIKDIPEKYMMCRRAIIPSYEKEGLLWAGLNNELKELNKEITYVAVSYTHLDVYKRQMYVMD